CRGRHGTQTLRRVCCVAKRRLFALASRAVPAAERLDATVPYSNQSARRHLSARGSLLRCLEGRSVHLRQRVAIHTQPGVVTTATLDQRCLKGSANPDTPFAPLHATCAGAPALHPESGAD